MKKYIFIFSITFLSCTTNHHSSNEIICSYRIKYVNHPSYFYIYLEDANDTLYVEEYRHNIATKSKTVIGDRKCLQLKKIIRGKIKYNNFSVKQIKVTHGNFLEFRVVDEYRSISAEYSNIGNYWAISKELGRFINELKTKDKAFENL